MDSLKNQKVAATASSNVASDPNNFQATNTASSVPSYQNKRRGNFTGNNANVRAHGISRGGATGPRIPRSPFPTYSGNGGSVYQSCNSGALIANSKANISPNKYRCSVSFSPKSVMAPIPSYGMIAGQYIPSLTISGTINTAGAAGGGDAPYLGATKTNRYMGTVTTGNNNMTVQENREQRRNFTGANAASTATAATEHRARYSHKVFVGGLPPDINEEEIINAFRRFGPLVVDWPHKITAKSEFPPKGYAFLIFHEENSVQQLVEACIIIDDKLYLSVSSTGIKDKPVQIRPWRLSDASYMLNPNIALDPRKTIFVGGVPRPLKAYELAMLMDRLYGGVCYAGIDTDPELKYPKGAGRVVFYNQNSYIAAISARFIQLQQGDIDKRVEVKPYVLGNQLCDECKGQRCGGKFAAYFCTNLSCLQYYCEYCWAAIHSWPGRQYHKPLVKEGGVRPRVTFR